MKVAFLCRKNSLSSGDRAAMRRLVQSTFARAVNTQGKDLGEVHLPSPLAWPVGYCHAVRMSELQQ